MEEVMQKYGIVIGSALFIIGASIFVYNNYQNKTKVQKGTKTKKMSNKKQNYSNKSDDRETPDSSSKSSSNKYRGYKTDSEGKVR